MTPTALQFRLNIQQRIGNLMSEKIEWITTKEAASILGVSGRQGVHYILNHLPDNAPRIRQRKIDLGKASILQIVKSDIEELRQYRRGN